MTKYGDFRKCEWSFKNQYTGYDALFIDYFTNLRHTLDQEVHADLGAVTEMARIGYNLSGEEYKEVLKAMRQVEEETAIDPRLEELHEQVVEYEA